MDGRLLIVFAPAVVAASWALYNIGRVLLAQLQKTLAQ